MAGDDASGASSTKAKKIPVELSMLRKQRGTFKSRVTVFKNFLDEIDENNITHVVSADISSRLSKFNEVYDEYYKTQLEIQVGFEEHTTPEIEEEELTKFESNYHSCVAIANCFIEKFNSLNLNAVSNYNPDQQSRQQGSDQSASNEIRLPKITLPTFSGNYDCWIEFKSTFETLVHSQPISKVTKFHHLRTALKDSAADEIKSFSISEESYEDAWRAVCDRYNNNKLLLRDHILALFNVESITRESSTRIRSLINNFTRHLSALKHLNQPIEHWGSLLKHFAISKLDSNTVREWESQYPDVDSTFEQLISFLRTRANVLETAVEPKRQIALVNTRAPPRQAQARCFLTNNKRINCYHCKGNHFLQNCSQFLNMPTNDRLVRAKALRLCTNCLYFGHGSNACPSRFSCRTCSGKHHTLLHKTTENPVGSVAIVANDDVAAGDSLVGIDAPASLTCYTSATAATCTHVFLTTALINVHDNAGNTHCARALLDAASQSHFMTQEFCKRLNLSIEDVSLTIHGVHEVSSRAQGRTRALISSRTEDYTAKLNFWTLPKITNINPPSFASTINVPSHVNLADPQFYKSGSVDILLGSGIFWHLLSSGQIQTVKSQPIWQNTRLGWVIGGSMSILKKAGKHASKCNLTTNSEENYSLESILKRFWELEDCASSTNTSSDQDICELTFSKTVKRVNGRYCVTIPLRDDINNIGNSYDIALRRLHSMERRFETNSVLRDAYRSFMSEYERLGHMSRVPRAQSTQTCIYLPHHAVLKPESSTTKLRVVFDGSAITTNNMSLNSYQLVGPTIQQDLLSILIRFRFYKIAITSDIAKMYRQVLVDPSQRDFQRILWRERPNDEVQEFQLNTVTYGTASAAFLAVRCIFDLADQHSDTFIRDRIKRDFYVDDFISGANSLEEAIYLCEGVNNHLSSAKFELRKWNSNNERLLQHLASQANDCHDFSKNDISKTLGLLWSSGGDYFTFHIKPLSSNERTVNTKRCILSDLARIFDPLGLLAPCTIFAKIFMQELWRLECGWDDPIDETLARRYQSYRASLPLLNNIKITRNVLESNERPHTEIHGFCDASKKAYGACLYIRTVFMNNVSTHLICTKTRVAPLKALTIPRLELCAAVLLSKLFSLFSKAIELQVDNYFMWTDSSIVLGWLKQNSTTLQTFVRNRINEIIQNTPNCTWRHVSTHDNPADLLSRGVSPQAIITNTLWWNGPDWLQKPEESWPRPCVEEIELPELRNIATCAISSSHSCLFDINDYSDLTKLERITAFVLRFVNNARKLKCRSNTLILTASEISNANKVLVRQTQGEYFNRELKALLTDKQITKQSSILNLNPFIENNIIRVGGRLGNSQLSLDKQHPMLLPSNAQLTKLIFEREHKRLLHAGPTAVVNSIRDRYWVINARSVARKTTHSCVTCFKAKPRHAVPQMGILPSCRVQPAPPFNVCGIDYAGPFLLKTSQIRNAKSYKAYVCIFVCMVTTAVHLELVTSLSTNSFIMTLRRFISRRGHPAEIYSDNGTNLVGAKNKLSELYAFLKSSNRPIQKFVVDQKITWHFSPPRAPHFGGLWEAGVKRMKFHLKRVVGEQPLTYELLSTLLCQVEAIMNSRPLTPLSSNPTDLDPLTPSHFLVGRKLTSLIDEHNFGKPVSTLRHFQNIQSMAQGFWKRWAREYLGELMPRKKWFTSNNEMHTQQPIVGRLALIHPEQEPCRWLTGRIVELHKGSDGVPRVATLKTASGLIKRPLVKIAVLPIYHEDKP